MAEGRNAKKKGKLIVISGPSGVGKSTICKEVVKRTGAALSVSVTTRQKSSQEENGRDYWFVSREEFERRIEKGEFLEYAEVFGNYYGTPRDKTQEFLAADRTVILEIDVQGGRTVIAAFPETVSIFIMPPKTDELAKRLDVRGRDSAETAAQRLAKANDEIAAAWRIYKHIVVNDELEKAINEVIKIIQESGDKK